jgi:hypothetical protein
MKRNLPVFAALAVGLMNSSPVASLKAGEFDKKTIITISQPVAVEGTILPSGQYVLKLQDKSQVQDVIEIFNSNETALLMKILPIHASRLQPAEKTEFSFYQASAGQPAALHTWFYPGDLTGFEFVKPRHAASAMSGEAGAAKKTPAHLPQNAAPVEPTPAGS